MVVFEKLGSLGRFVAEIECLISGRMLVVLRESLYLTGVTMVI